MTKVRKTLKIYLLFLIGFAVVPLGHYIADKHTYTWGSIFIWTGRFLWAVAAFEGIRDLSIPKRRKELSIFNKTGIVCTVILIAAFAVVIVAGTISGLNTRDEDSQNNNEIAQEDTTVDIQTLWPFVQPTTWEEAVANTGHKNITKQTFDEQSGTITVEYNSGKHKTDMIGLATFVSNMVSLGIEAFKIEGVETINVQYDGIDIDGLGNESVFTIARIIINKSKFEEFTWKNLQYRDVYSSLLSQSAEFYIDPDIRVSDLSETGKILYVPDTKETIVWKYEESLKN